MADTGTYSVQAAGVYAADEQMPVPGACVKVVHVVIPGLALPGRVLADLRCARALGAAWAGAATLLVVSEGGPSVTIRFDREKLAAYRAANPRLVRLHVGTAELLVDAPKLPGV